MLTCGCDDYADGADGWFYYEPSDYSEFSEKRRKRCVSCKQLIDIGAICLKFSRARYAKNDIEERIYGEGCNIDMAPWYLCEKCGDLYYSLRELGFCTDPQDVIEDHKEYVTFWVKQSVTRNEI